MKKILVDLEREICALKEKLKELEPFVKDNASLAIVYNRTLIEKAILVDKYKKILNEEGFCNKVKNIFKFKKKEKRICDFFYENRFEA